MAALQTATTNTTDTPAAAISNRQRRNAARIARLKVTAPSTQSRKGKRSTAVASALPPRSEVVRPAPPVGDLAHRDMREPEAKLSAFRAYLREVQRERGPEMIVGVAGSVHADPVASWLRHTRASAYSHVEVRAGDSVTGVTWPFGRRATYQAFARQGRAGRDGWNGRGARLGLGVCDIHLTRAINWLDAAFPDGALITVSACLAALAEMDNEWPPCGPFTTQDGARIR